MEAPMADTLVITERRLGTRCCSNNNEPTLPTEKAQEVADALQLLAHPIRLQILDMLARRQGQVCVCDLEAALPVKQPTVSHHLKMLREAGLIDCERHGLWAYYFVRRETLDAVRNQIGTYLNALA
jgi:ArsR family transcriptional regulator